MAAGIDTELEEADSSVLQIVNDVCDDICFHYCKFPEQYGQSDDCLEKLFDEHCYACSLNRLR